MHPIEDSLARLGQILGGHVLGLGNTVPGAAGHGGHGHAAATPAGKARQVFKVYLGIAGFLFIAAFICMWLIAYMGERFCNPWTMVPLLVAGLGIFWALYVKGGPAVDAALTGMAFQTQATAGVRKLCQTLLVALSIGFMGINAMPFWFDKTISMMIMTGFLAGLFMFLSAGGDLNLPRWRKVGAFAMVGVGMFCWAMYLDINSQIFLVTNQATTEKECHNFDYAKYFENKDRPYLVCSATPQTATSEAAPAFSRAAGLAPGLMYTTIDNVTFVNGKAIKQPGNSFRPRTIMMDGQKYALVYAARNGTLSNGFDTSRVMLVPKEHLTRTVAEYHLYGNKLTLGEMYRNKEELMSSIPWTWGALVLVILFAWRNGLGQKARSLFGSTTQTPAADHGSHDNH